METPVKLLIVEDEMIIGAKISMQLTHLGYEVTGILPRGEEAILHVEENKPDIILLDINLKGKIDGIETAQNQNERASKVTSSSLISIDIFNFRFIFECSNFSMNEQQKKTTWFCKPI